MTRRCALLAALLATACAGDQPPDPPVLEQQGGDDEALAPAPAPAGEDGAAEADLVARFSAIQPIPTRARDLRFSTEAVHDPRVAAIFLDRLARGGEPAEVRAALAEALPRTGGAYAHALVELIDAEPDARVRALLVAGARRAGADGLPALARGLRDPAAEVRAEAARTAGALAEGVRLAAPLTAALADAAAEARAAAAEALGVLRVAAARDPLARLLGDGDADVRLASLRALGQIDGAWLERQPALRALADDPDPRVARLADRAVRAR